VQNTPTKTYPLSILGDLDDTLEDTAQEPSEHDEERCENCKFWLADPSDELLGLCRRYPPNVKMDDGGEDLWEHPTTAAPVWCGEWKPVRKP
jgi:hypothetical protein